MKDCPISPDGLRDWICIRENSVDGANIIYELADWLEQWELKKSLLQIWDDAHENCESDYEFLETLDKQNFRERLERLTL